MRWALWLWVLSVTAAHSSRLLDSLHETPTPTPSWAARTSRPATTAGTSDGILSFVLKQSDTDYPPAINRIDADAIDLYRQDRLTEVIDRASTSLRAMPKDVRAICLRGAAYFALGQLEAGVGDYVRAAHLDPRAVPVVSGPLGAAHLKLGRALAERGKLSEARQALQTALRWDPRLAGPYSELARLAFAEKNFQECIDLANRALALESSYAEALGNRGACFSALGQNTAALKDLDRAILKLPRSASLRMTRAGISESLGDCRKVAEDTDLAVAIDPGLSDSADRLLAQCRHRGDRQR